MKYRREVKAEHDIQAQLFCSLFPFLSVQTLGILVWCCLQVTSIKPVPCTPLGTYCV